MTGIDVSANQGVIDWGMVKANVGFAASFAYIKSCEGVGYNDPQRALNSQNAKNAGLLIGYYHFASLNSLDVIGDSTSEAEYFMKSMSLLPKADMPPVLDIEVNEMFVEIATGKEVKKSIAVNTDGSIKEGYLKKPRLSKDQVLAWINNFIKIVQKSYPAVVLYSYKPFLDENLPANHNLGSIPLWLAQYTIAAEPSLPHGWDTYFIHQYSDKGQISGVKGNVDLNRMKTSL